MNPNQIEIGDTVRVVLVYHQNDNPEMFEGVVLYTPCATGDCWHIRARYLQKGNQYPTDGALHYVQTFQEMVLVEKATSVQ